MSCENCFKAKLHHPDAGGDAEQVHRIQRAYEQAVAS
jgi:curved DNA-binding protein CbpA